MKIERIIVFKQKYGCDLVMLYTDLPPSVYPYTDNVALRFECYQNSGEDYVKINFPDIKDVKVIKVH